MVELWLRLQRRIYEPELGGVIPVILQVLEKNEPEGVLRAQHVPLYGLFLYDNLPVDQQLLSPNADMVYALLNIQAYVFLV